MERWERELGRLREVDAPSSMRARIDQGPHGDAAPSSREIAKRIGIVVVSLAVFAGAVALIAPAFPLGDDAVPLGPSVEPARITLVADDNDAVATLGFEGDEATGVTGSYCWLQSNGAERCADTVPPSPFSEDQLFQIPQGTPFELANPDGADPVNLSVAQGVDPMDEGAPTSFDDLGGRAPGRYVLTVTASWAGRGDNVQFFFGVEIVGQTSPSHSPVPDGTAVVTVQRDPLRVTLSYDGQTQAALLSDTWEPGDMYDGHPLFKPSIDHFDELLRIPAGTPFVVDGDVTGWTTTPQPHSDSTRMPTDPGPVVWVFRSGWSDLEFDAAFGLEIEPANSSSQPPEPSGGTPSPAAPTPTGSPAASLAGSSWILVSIDGDGVLPAHAPTMYFGDGIGGSTGCNDYGGTWSDDGDVLTTSGIVMTLVGCPGDIGATETKFLKVLDGQPRVAIDGSTLTLSSEGGSAAFARMDGDDPAVMGSFLDCPADDHVPWTFEGAMDQPGPPAYFTVNLTGLKEGDGFERIAGSANLAEPSRWIVTRRGLVVAEIEYPSLDGVACRGSGVQGA